MISITKKLFLISTSALFFGFFTVNEVNAAGSLSLSPATGTGNRFTVDVLLNTGTDATTETDLALNFDPLILQISNVTFGTLYPQNSQNINNNVGSLMTFSYFSGILPEDNFVGTGTLATIQFTGQAPGTSAVTINCTPSATNDSNIKLQGSNEDILDCNQVVNGSYTVTTVAASPTPSDAPNGASPTNVPEIGSSGADTPTPSPVEELLETASITPTLALSLFGVILLMGGVVLFVL